MPRVFLGFGLEKGEPITLVSKDTVACDREGLHVIYAVNTDDASIAMLCTIDSEQAGLCQG